MLAKACDRIAETEEQLYILKSVGIGEDDGKLTVDQYLKAQELWLTAQNQLRLTFNTLRSETKGKE